MSKVTYAILDTETGGLYPYRHPMCSIGIVSPAGETYHAIIQPVPGMSYDSKALEVNGFTLEDLRRDGIPERDAMAGAMNFLIEKCPDAFIAGLNIQFDMNFVSAAIKRVGGDVADDFFKRVHKRTFELQTLAIAAHDAGLISLPDDPKRPGVPQTNLNAVLSSLGMSRDSETHFVVEDCLKTRDALLEIRKRFHDAVNAGAEKAPNSIEKGVQIAGDSQQPVSATQEPVQLEGRMQREVPVAPVEGLRR